jgi:23S rRNA pseudoU1915 N3-methylase RlmH
MAGKYLELAVILSAVDNMSGTIRNALNNTSSGYNSLANSQERADAQMRSGLKMGAGAKAAIDVLASLQKKYANVQEAQQDLRVSMLKPGGGIDERMYQKDVALAELLSKKYAGTQMAYYDMIRAMGENRIDGKDILGGIGNAVGALSELFNTMPAESALFAARMKNDMKVPAAEMIKMIDLVARLKQVGAGHTGAETIQNLTEFYSKAGLGATNLGLSGTHDAMELGALGGMYIAKGQDAPSVGTTFRRIFDNIANVKKMKEMNEEAAKFGKHLVFFDQAGKFKGVQNFVAQLSTLQGLGTSQISQILGPAGSAQGMSGDVLKSISLSGKDDFQNFLFRISDQADIMDKVTEKQKAYNQVARITESNVENMEANIGKSYNPLVQSAAKLTGEWANALSEVAKQHQTATATGAGAVGIVGGALALGSAIQFIRAVWNYSKLPVLFSALGRTALFDTLAVGAERFAFSILRTVIPAIESMLVTLGEIALPLGLLYAVLKYPQQFGKAIKDISMPVLHAPGAAYDAIKKTWDYQVNGIKTPDVKSAPVGPLDFVKLNKQLDSAKHNQPNLTQFLKDDLAKGSLGGPQKRYESPHAGTTIHYAPQVSVYGENAGSNFKKMLDDHKNELMRILNAQKNDHARFAY